LAEQTESNEEMKRLWAESAFEYGRLFLTSLITTASGGLIALLALGAQAKAPNPFTRNYSGALSCVSLALLAAMLSAMFAYFNQYSLAFGKERDWLRYVAWVAGLAGFLLLALGGLLSYWAATERFGG
jgi:O-antigen/teichoic acid export membrane protein